MRSAAAESRIGLCCSSGSSCWLFAVFYFIFSIEVSVLKNRICSYSLITDCAFSLAHQWENRSD